LVADAAARRQFGGRESDLGRPGAYLHRRLEAVDTAIGPELGEQLAADLGVRFVPDCEVTVDQIDV
jgi:hypothetical protein